MTIIGILLATFSAIPFVFGLSIIADYHHVFGIFPIIISLFMFLGGIFLIIDGQ
jgi:hypothetical protein